MHLEELDAPVGKVQRMLRSVLRGPLSLVPAQAISAPGIARRRHRTAFYLSAAEHMVAAPDGRELVGVGPDLPVRGRHRSRREHRGSRRVDLRGNKEKEASVGELGAAVLSKK